MPEPKTCTSEPATPWLPYAIPAKILTGKVMKECCIRCKRIIFKENEAGITDELASTGIWNRGFIWTDLQTNGGRTTCQVISRLLIRTLNFPNPTSPEEDHITVALTLITRSTQEKAAARAPAFRTPEHQAPNSGVPAPAPLAPSSIPCRNGGTSIHSGRQTRIPR
jgi:hypothetical protein